MGTSGYFHSVRLVTEKCKGCVSCIKHCPTEAIRIRGGKAHIIEERCIDCGECIRWCPSHAKAAYTDMLADLQNYSYNVALPAPSLYAQFHLDVSIGRILKALREIGFDDVFEVAVGAEIVARAIDEHLREGNIKRPAISSACPTVIRLMQVKFPELLEHIVPFEAPIDVAARLAREEAAQKTGLSQEQIGIWFITPCPAKMTAVRQPLGGEKSELTGTIAISQIYGELLKRLSRSSEEAVDSQQSSWQGVGWGMAGGETVNMAPHNILVVHEIHHVSEVLEQMALGKLKDVDYIECLACAGGCIGGSLTVENRFVAERRMKERVRRLRKERPMQADRGAYARVRPRSIMRGSIEPRPMMKLDEDIFAAMHKVELMEETLERLPGLDCGSCGSPSCKALAEDIVQGKASETDCVFRLREKVRDLAQEMVDLAQKLPPSLRRRSDDDKG